MLDDATRYQLLKLLTEHPNITQRELAGRIGMSLGKVNYCLRALAEKGWIKANNFRRNPNKAAYGYWLTPEGLQEKAAVTLRFLRRKMAEYDTLKAEIAALRQEVDDLAASGIDTGRGTA